MKVQRLGDALLRSHPSPLLSFLAPSIPLSTWTSTAIRRTPLQHSLYIRNFTSHSSSLLAPVTATATAEKEPDPPEPSSPPSSSNSTEDGETIDGLLNSVIKPRSKQPSLLDTRETSADQMRQALARDRASSTNRLQREQGTIARLMKKPELLQDQVRRALHPIGRELPPLPPPVRLDAFIGRSQEVDSTKGMDLGRALRQMEMKLAINSVRADFNRQRFHERAGLKRKRLKSQRWRKRFKQGFRAVVAKVDDMRRRGW